MIEGLKPYAEYKESGLPWASRVPAHWSLIPNRAVLRKRKVLVGENHKNYQLLSLTKGGVIVRDISTGKGKFSSDMGTSQEVRKGDFVFCLFDVPETPRTVGLSMHDGMITGAYTVFESRKLPMEGVRYLERFYLAMDDQKLLSPLYSGLRHTIPPPRFLGTKTPLPPADEQAAIVRFLDHANRKIDGFIRAKRKLIGLLNEQKQAIIHRAVTRGLHSVVPLKPSGIPWLGDIPQHWEVPRVKQCARKISKGTTPSTEGRAILESGPVRFLKAENISAGRITDKPLCFIDEETNRVIRRSQLAENDILFVIAGATLGKTAVVSGEVLPANTNQAVAFIRPNSRVVPSFLELWLQSPRIKELIWLNAVQSAQPNLSMADLGNFVTPVPPRNEQQQILDFVKEATKPMSDAIARTEREIALMQEYRTRLTADLVTGKLDVREAAAKLPDLPTDSVAEPLTDEALDDTETEDAEA